jgi:aspartokinase
MLRAALEACASVHADPRELESSDDGGRFLVNVSLTPDWASGARALVSACDGHAQIEEGFAMVSAVGDALGRDATTVGRALDALRDAGVAPLRTATTSLRIAFLVADAQADEGVRALHRALVNTAEVGP